MSDPVVYLVDPDVDFTRRVARLLGRTGLRSHAFENSQAFLDLYPRGDEISCVVVEFVLSGMSGLELQRALLPRAATTAIIFASADATIQGAVQAMKAGAHDFLVKPIHPDVLADAIQQAIQIVGKRARDASSLAHRDGRLESLTLRQRQILDLVVGGLPSKAIAAELRLSKRTIDVHRSHIMSKLSANSIADLVRTVLKGAHD